MGLPELDQPNRLGFTETCTFAWSATDTLGQGSFEARCLLSRQRKTGESLRAGKNGYTKRT